MVGEMVTLSNLMTPHDAIYMGVAPRFLKDVKNLKFDSRPATVSEI